MSETAYCIDASSLISMKDRCPDDIFPGVWDRLGELAGNGRLIAPMEVKKEIEQGSDPDLLRWVKRHRLIFKRLDAEQIRVAQQIIARCPNLIDHGKERADADPFVIALAKIQNDSLASAMFPVEYIVVTEEGGKQFKIPYVCKQWGLRCIRSMELFRLENWKFGK